MTIIQSGAANRVLLAVGDTISRIIDKNDRSTAMLFGDAGTVTALETDASSVSHFIMGTDGQGMCNLIVPNGAFKNYSTASDERLDGKNPAFLFMDGAEVFNFTLQSVPPLISKTVQYAEKTTDDYDAFLFHQANKFMLDALRKKLKVTEDKLPIFVENCGNTVSSTIPFVLENMLNNGIFNTEKKLMLVGFGVGYSWAGCFLNLKIGESK
jgi:3-oxoacyl-[acyl-carrier-protein] synthase-3